MGRRRTACAVLLAAAMAGCASSAPGGASDQAQETGAHGGHAETAQNHGEQGHHEGDSAVVPGARTVAVAARSFAFEPAEFTMAAGEDVTIELMSTDTLHDFNVEGAEGHVVADAGETATGGLKIVEPGTYPVYCSVPGHREGGMEGTLIVQ